MIIVLLWIVRVVHRDRFVAEFEEYSDEKLVAAIDFLEKWNANRPKKTRQSEFLKIFPRIDLNENGCVGFCPTEFDDKHICPIEEYGTAEAEERCKKCEREFWLTEIEEG